jgi:hypothetical protein
VNRPHLPVKRWCDSGGDAGRSGVRKDHVLEDCARSHPLGHRVITTEMPSRNRIGGRSASMTDFAKNCWNWRVWHYMIGEPPLGRDSRIIPAGRVRSVSDLRGPNRSQSVTGMEEMWWKVQEKSVYGAGFHCSRKLRPWLCRRQFSAELVSATAARAFLIERRSEWKEHPRVQRTLGMRLKKYGEDRVFLPTTRTQGFTATQKSYRFLRRSGPQSEDSEVLSRHRIGPAQLPDMRIGFQRQTRSFSRILCAISQIRRRCHRNSSFVVLFWSIPRNCALHRTYRCESGVCHSVRDLLWPM